jgi:hypothetical protein
MLIKVQRAASPDRQWWEAAPPPRLEQKPVAPAVDLLARWTGQKAALQLLGQDGAPALDSRPPRSVPFFNGTAWFKAPYRGWLTVQDGLTARQRRAS